MSKTYAITKDKFLNESEMLALEENLKTATLMNATLIWTLLLTGARAQEVLNITTKDLDHENGTILIHGLKKSNNREIPIPRWLFKDILKLPVDPANGRPFPIGYQRLYQVWTYHCAAKKGPHSARHAFAINLYKRTNNLNLVKLALGHKSISNTIVYSEYAFTTSELRKLIVV